MGEHNAPARSIRLRDYMAEPTTHGNIGPQGQQGTGEEVSRDDHTHYPRPAWLDDLAVGDNQ